MKMTKDEIRQMFWHEVNGLERPEDPGEVSYNLEGLCYGDPKEIVYMNVLINWKWEDTSFAHAFGTESDGYFEPYITFAEIVGEMNEQILDITNIVQ